MPKATKICKVCGKEYEYCHTVRRVAGIFRWQDVACSPECGSTYLARIRASRAETSADMNVAATDADVNKPVSDYSDLAECDGEDTWFEDDFDDEAEDCDM